MSFSFLRVNYTNQGFPSSGNTITFSPSAAAAVGDTVILVLGLYQGNGSGPIAVNSVTDTAGNIWSIDSHSTSGSQSSTIVSCQVENAIATTDTITVNLSTPFTSGSVSDVDLVEFTGGSNSVDQKATNGAYGTTVTVTLPSSTTNIGDLLIFNMMGGNGTLTWPTGFTKEGLRCYWNLPGTESAFSETVSGTGSADMAASLIAYSPSIPVNTKGNFLAWIGE